MTGGERPVRKVRVLSSHVADGYVRVVISHWFRVLQVSLDGLQRSGVENFLSFLTVTSAPSAQRLPVQNMNPQQETVVHDLETLQDLQVRRKST